MLFWVLYAGERKECRREKVFLSSGDKKWTKFEKYDKICNRYIVKDMENDIRKQANDVWGAEVDKNNNTQKMRADGKLQNMD